MKIFISIFLTFLIFSCRGKSLKFNDSDLVWIPYKEADTLIFTSNTGDTDSLFIKKPKRYMTYDVDPLSPYLQDSIEKIHIPYFFSNDTNKRLGQYPSEKIFAMTQTKKNGPRIGFGVATNDALFYGLKYYNVKELESAKLISLQTDHKKYNDVLVIEPDTSNKKWSKRDNYVLKMYWSKSEGLVRFDKNNNIYYTLTKKHSQ